MWYWRARLHMCTMNQGLRATSCLYKATHSTAYHCKSFSQHRARTPHNSPFPPVGAKGLERKRSSSQASLTRKQAHHCDSSNCWLSCIACVGKFLWPYYILCSSPFSVVMAGLSLQHPWAFAFGLLGTYILHFHWTRAARPWILQIFIFSIMFHTLACTSHFAIIVYSEISYNSLAVSAWYYRSHLVRFARRWSSTNSRGACAAFQAFPKIRRFMWS